MKKMFLLAASAFICSLVFAQQNEVLKPDSADFLKGQLQSLSEKISRIQERIENAKTDTARVALINDIDRRQVEAVKLSGSFVERFAQGAKATETILYALESGVSIAELSSPFISPTFTKKYDSWIGKWGKFIPSVIIPSVALGINNLSPNQKLASVPIGITITGLISAIAKGDDKKIGAMQQSVSEFQSMLDLFDLNRLVYNDVQKLKSFISSANKSDSTLSKELINYWSSNKDLFLQSDAELSGDQRFKDYINKAQIYISRFQVKLTKVKFVLDHVESMINSYYNRRIIKEFDANTATKIQRETKEALDKLVITYNNFKNHWEELQGKFYQISPEELRKLDSYYVLESLRLQTQIRTSTTAGKK